MKDFDEEEIMKLLGSTDEDIESKGPSNVYGKYMVIGDKAGESEVIYGVYDYEIDALRRYRKEKKKRKICVIKADIEYHYYKNVSIINEYKEIE